MKRFFAVSSILIAALIIFGCESAPKEPRSLKTTANTVANPKAVKAVIENYNMEEVNFEKIVPLNKNYPIKELIVAKNQENNECVAYCSIKTPYKETVRFAYLSINGETTSCVKMERNLRPSGTALTYLNNYDEGCRFDERGHAVAWHRPDDFTRGLARYRNFMKQNILNNYDDIIFDEWINPRQMELLDPRNMRQ